MWWRDSIWGINDTHLCTIIILYKMKVHVVKDDVETEIPDVAVKKYLQENNLKKKKAAKFKLHVGLVNQKTVIQFKL